MSTPARILRCPLHGSAARVSPAATCPAPSPWGAPSAIERRHSSEAPAFFLSTTSRPPRASPLPSTPKKNLATLQNPASPPKLIPDAALFTYHPPLLSPEPGNNKPPDERKVKLGKTLRILQSHLPTLLQSPPPQGILSPRITLHLFPSTHPHLPTVSGRVAYTAALWSSPIAWNRLPLVGNVRLHILSERMIESSAYDSRDRPAGGRRLKWSLWRCTDYGALDK
ncbi:hypothetical protein CHGG_07844 [Chaetomium globosum CBS 148.51]|uniref:Uncharacterized protein n=1 Tax=Chaetomium globosum (strain ATCC 6205 / CBS 148.51 / DSM 1962 / NBRC 6347 / NRRL 1970) TaxID=306901 RepID=Q2GW10_CHAGB|nr:uncharacterized protein CHGG_07844 [Chaetomium globosum CBS 148.51]EAQ86591.1 hypothetical protein CHGG_07844 [Chaetomium globosum CBS 148.51]